MEAKAILIKQDDNVATALVDIEGGEEITIKTDDAHIRIRINLPIPFGHKFAVRNIAEGEDILKYGEIIGRATEKIEIGSHAHIQNVESLRGRGDMEK